MNVVDTIPVTYSPALTLVPTYECFNRCTYCNFRVNPHEDEWMSVGAAAKRLQWARDQGVIEILVLSGEVHPHSRRRSRWIRRVYDICRLALDMGFLPHTNVGPLSRDEMTLLKQVNVSMGLMVEQVTPTLLSGVHRHAPSKCPNTRLKQLEQAGKLRIPFTTGLLLGIGETERDRLDSLAAIADIHARWGHIQEVILQPHQPGSRQAQSRSSVSAAELIAWVEIARTALPAEITIQIPPNLLTSPEHLTTAIANGARDLGGLSPVDEVNPDYPHPTPAVLSEAIVNQGWILRPRLPVYPKYDDWLPTPLRPLVSQWRQHLSRRTVATPTH